jgi:uncharacterized protein (UPF0210 family)
MLVSKRDTTVRTTRFCSQPLINVKDLKPREVNKLTIALDRLCRKESINWFCFPIGEVKNEKDYEFIKILPAIMSKSKISFSNVIVSHRNKLNFTAINECAKQVKKISRTDLSGFDNFRFCISANVKPNGAFFPYSWHKGEDGFSIGLETIDLIIKNIRRNKDLSETRRKLIDVLSGEFLSIDRIAREIERETGYKYYGLDLSLAPYPTNEHSIGKAIQKLGLDRFGVNGTLFLTSYLTNLLKYLEKKLPVKTIGFTGVMYPVLEDRFLTSSNDMNILNMESLLLYSSVCGCGPDMIPLPGDISEKEISSIILDMASLALMLDKPLIARLVPIPNKKSGDLTNFDYHFFHNTKIMNDRKMSLKRNILKNNSEFEFL